MSSDSWRRLRIFCLSLALLQAGGSCAHQASGGTRLLSGDPVEAAKKYNLVDVRKAVPGISIDLRYATSQNITGQPIYPANMPCLLRAETAAKLKKAQELLRPQGYALRVWDAYRPPEAQETLHKHGSSTGMFLSPNTGWSRHCGGIAVDLTLIDLQGNEQRMPTGFDQDFAHASINYRGNDPQVAQSMRILQTAMKQAGFIQLETEWWHFDDADYLTDPQPVIYGWRLALPGMAPP
ncbi:M15 family metallopeptidase [Prosthecobacter sp.]|uniref:M15 family metallopeptidase n=1 Tax=Prosthecobacter sp. TaxID=1965333 RepID=UPI003783C3F1